MSNSKFPLNTQVLNIATNIGRVGGWVADSYESKQKLIVRFMDETEYFMRDLGDQDISDKFKPTLEMFKKEFKALKSEKINQENRLKWAERAITWANILQHRAKLV